jgi:hypothetical protein
LFRPTLVCIHQGDSIGICGWLLEFRCALPLADNEDAGDSSSISNSLDACLVAESMTLINPVDKLRVMLRISEALGRTLDTQALLTNMIDGFLDISPMDAEDARQQRYSIGRIRAGIAGMTTADPAAVGEALLADVGRHSAGQPQSDDMAMVVFGRLGS